MPNILVRGHMRFESDSDSEENRKLVLEERIRLLECEVEGLRKELKYSIETEARWEKENDGLIRNSHAIENRRAKRDSLVNAVEAFEKEITEVAQCKGADALITGYGRTLNGGSENEIASEVRQRLLEMMTTVQCLYPNIGLERIFRK